MILSLFGPDGVGKSTVSQSLCEAGWQVFSGTGVASWPDQTWHKSLVEQGIEESSFDDEAHFLEKIQRAHQLARSLENKYGKVAIDSDPFHKTLMHDYRKLLPNKLRAKKRLHERLEQLSKLANITQDQPIHIYFQVDESKDTPIQAEILQKRLSSRGNLAHFDPQNVEQSRASIEACIALKDLLTQKGLKVITITTDRSFILEDFVSHLTE